MRSDKMLFCLLCPSSSVVALFSRSFGYFWCCLLATTKRMMYEAVHLATTSPYDYLIITVSQLSLPERPKSTCEISNYRFTKLYHCIVSPSELHILEFARLSTTISYQISRENIELEPGLELGPPDL